jgi:hypothetical protein
MKNMIADMPDYKKRITKKLSSYDLASIAYNIDDKLLLPYEMRLSELYFLLNQDLFIEHVDSKWQNFLKCFSSSFICDNLDNFEVEIIESSLPGFHNEYAAILMIDRNKEIWGAYYDIPNLYYFTSKNEYKKKFP